MQRLYTKITTRKRHALALILILVLTAICIFTLGTFLVNTDQGGTSAEKTAYASREFRGQTFEDCLQTTDINQKVDCWLAYLTEKVHTEGLKRTFEIFTEIYNADPAFIAQGCHGAVHVIGEAAYDLYASGAPLEFSDKTAVCGYGFYHGFLGTLLHADPDMQGAVEFCESLRDSMSKNGDEAYTTCFHGIGHGMVEEEPLHEYYWGNIEALLDPALATCSTLPETFQQRECVDGAFNGLNIFMSNGKYGFTYDIADPFGWCDRFKDTRMYFVSCHFEMAQSFVAKGLITDEATQVLSYITQLDPELQHIVVDVAVGNMLQSDVVNDDHSDYFRQCGNFPSDDLEYACLRGIVGGLLAYGEPGNEEQKARTFCASPQATNDQRMTCEEILAAYTQ